MHELLDWIKYSGNDEKVEAGRALEEDLRRAQLMVRVYMWRKDPKMQKFWEDRANEIQASMELMNPIGLVL